MGHLLAGQLLGRKFGLATKELSYHQKIIATAPIGYWPQTEITGTAAVNYGTLGTAANGAYTGALLAQTSAPGGGKAPYFDGTNDTNNVITAALIAAFNGALGTMTLWFRAAAASLWSDGSIDVWYALFVDTNNYIQIYKTATNDQIMLYYKAGNAVKSVSTTAYANTNWNMLGITWSKAADQMKAYVNGAQIGTTQTSLGTWAGALAKANVGSTGTPADYPGKGYISRPTIYDKALTAAEILALYNGATIP